MKQVDGDAARIQIWWNAMSNQITVSLILDLENGNTHLPLFFFLITPTFNVMESAATAAMCSSTFL